MELRIIYGILIGTISGLLGGGLGLAGSLIMLPGLLLLNVIPDYRKTIGTILFSLLPPISLFAVIEYIKRKQVDYLIGIILCVTYFIGAYFGSIVIGLQPRWETIMVFRKPF